MPEDKQTSTINPEVDELCEILARAIERIVSKEKQQVKESS